MMTFAPFYHRELLGRAKQIVTASALALVLTACATTEPSRIPTPSGPVIDKEVDNENTDTPDKGVDKEDKEAEVKDDKDETIDVGPYYNNRKGITLPHMQGRDTKRLALLLPFSARSERLRAEAASMMKAAELSVFDRETPDVLLFALDTGGTERGARTATEAALKAGADVILGPVLAGSVNAAKREARRSGTPVLAFSTDQRVAGNGAYLLSFPPEGEVERIVDFTSESGTRRYAFIGPNSEYGRRVKSVYERAIVENGGSLTAFELYTGRDISVMQDPAKRLADQHQQAERAARRNGGVTPMAFEAIILPEGGTALRSLAPLLPFYDIDPADVQFLGTGLWQNDETVREPALAGGMFAAPDPEAQAEFKRHYDRTYGEESSRLASLAYDAVSIGAYVADGNPKKRKDRMETETGFYGVDGPIRFGPDGKPQRGLAVYQIQNGRFVVIDPAPRTLNEDPS